MEEVSAYFRAEIRRIDEKDEQGRTPLMLAIQEGRADVADLLIALDANVNAADAHGETPLMLAAARGLESVVVRLIEAGADPNAADTTDGLTALDWALLGEHDRVAALLRTAGTILN
jgi:ankyrin repeat protein